MALYWPNERVALDIIDDPDRRPFDGDESYTVLRVRMCELSNRESYEKVRRRLCELLGHEIIETPNDPKTCCADSLLNDISSALGIPRPTNKADAATSDECEDDTPESIQILATSKLEGEIMASHARAQGQEVRGITIWNGPVPDGSYEFVSPSMRMSTPEYFFLRKANELSFGKAVALGLELCGKYRTVATQYDRKSGYDFLRAARTNKARIRKYLRGAAHTKEGKRARRVLRMVENDCPSPIVSYLYLMLCLPTIHGGFGLEHPTLALAYVGKDGFVPSPTGPYLASDLIWQYCRTAVQYIGEDDRPSKDERAALEVDGTSVIYVNDQCLAEPFGIVSVAQSVASATNATLPEMSPAWIDAHERLREELGVPSYDHMRLTTSDIKYHLG